MRRDHASRTAPVPVSPGKSQRTGQQRPSDVEGSRTSVSTSSIASAQRALKQQQQHHLQHPSISGAMPMVPLPQYILTPSSMGGGSLQHKASLPNQRVLVPIGISATASAVLAPGLTPLGPTASKVTHRTTHMSPGSGSPTPPSHLEYVGTGPTLARDAYLPQEEKSPAARPATSGPGVLALQEATTGLLLRHLAHSDGDDEGDEECTSSPTNNAPNVPGTTTSSTAAGSEGTATCASAATTALWKAAPVMSAALLEAGVDDRVSPFLLDQLIRRTRNQQRQQQQKHRAVAAKRQAAAGNVSGGGALHAVPSPPGRGKTKGQEDSPMRKSAAATAGAAAAAAPPLRTALAAAALAQDAGSPPRRVGTAGANAVTVPVSTDERSAVLLRYHEPPALQDAFEAVYSESVRGKDGGGGSKTPAGLFAPAVPSAGSNLLSDLIDEGAADAGTTAGSAAAGLGAVQNRSAWNTDGAAVQLKQPHQLSPAAAAGLSSTEHAHIAAAVSASDAAFVRQLVGYYCARAEAAAPARATAEAPTRANLRLHTLRQAQSVSGAGERVGSAGARSGTGSRPPRVTSANSVRGAAFSFYPATPTFSVLEAVLHVSREFVAQRSSNGVPGQSTIALTERRRGLVDRLTSLTQTRIPETWWVSSLPYVGRLVTAAPSLGPSPINDLTGTGDRMHHVPSTASHTLAATFDSSSGFATRVSSSSGALGGRPSVAGQSWTSVPSGGFGSEVDPAVKDALRQVSMQGTGAANNAVAGQLVFGSGGSGHNTIFPAPRPVERSQVYLLAEVLDRMLRDSAHPRWLALLADPQVARYVLADGDNAESPVGSGSPLRQPGTLDADLWGTPGEQRLMAYTDAATHVLDILDTGLAELVRQVSCHCAERGALLDVLRQSSMDIATSHVHLLSQVKQQAHLDALEAQTLRREKAALQAQLEETQTELASVRETHEALCTRVEPLQRKSDRLDELMARVAAKARRFDTFRHDDHAALLQVLEEAMTQSAGAALDNFFTEMHDLQVRHSGLDEGAEAARGGLDGTEMPSVAVARSQALEQRQTMERLYTESHQLLRGLQEAVDATNTLCGPLYNAMVLKDVSPAAKVATSRWTSVARAVGAFEKDKRHRQRVYEVFMEYCTNYRHKLAAAEAAAAASKAGAGAGGVRGLQGNTDSAYSHGESFLVQDDVASHGSLSAANSVEDELMLYNNSATFLDSTSDSRNLDHRQPRRPRRTPTPGTEESETLGAAATVVLDTDEAASAAAGAREMMAREALQGGAIITRADLEAMQALDCTVEEVNALFRKDFNVHTYLQGSWKLYVQARQQTERQGAVISATRSTPSPTPGGAGAGSGRKQPAPEHAYALSMHDVLQMLSDVHATLAEMTVRMKAVSSSAVLQAGLRPPLEPPSHPEQPCPLCQRRDAHELDRQRRREAMARIARDLQSKMDAVEAKCRAAMNERDEALGEVRRLKMELQYSGKPNGASTTSADASSTLQPQSQLQHDTDQLSSSMPTSPSLDLRASPTMPNVQPQMLDGLTEAEQNLRQRRHTSAPRQLGFDGGASAMRRLSHSMGSASSSNTSVITGVSFPAEQQQPPERSAAGLTPIEKSVTTIAGGTASTTSLASANTTASRSTSVSQAATASPVTRSGRITFTDSDVARSGGREDSDPSGDLSPPTQRRPTAIMVAKAGGRSAGGGGAGAGGVGGSGGSSGGMPSPPGGPSLSHRSARKPGVTMATPADDDDRASPSGSRRTSASSGGSK